MSDVTVQGTEHWTRKGDLQLFLWRKSAVEPRDAKGTILFVHGSSMASQPDVRFAGARPARFIGDGLVCARAASTPGAWTTEGYGRSDKHRADQLRHRQRRRRPRGAAAEYIARTTRRFESSWSTASLRGRLRAALVRCAPSRSGSRGSRSMPSCGPARAARPLPSGRKKLPEFQAQHRRPIDRAFVHSIFDRDHPRHGGRGRRSDAFSDDDSRARSLRAHRDLRRHVFETAAGRPGEDRRANDHYARPVRRHRRFR